MFQNLENHWVLYIAKGALLTIQYSIVSALFGILLGILITLTYYYKNKYINYIIAIYISVIRGTPFLLQLFIIYFLMPEVLNVHIPTYVAGVIALSLNSSAYVSEIIRGGVEGVDKGQFEAAKSLSIPYYDTMKEIILPQAMKSILPSLINEIISLIKESAVIGIIGVADLMRRAQIVSAEQYDFFKPLCVAAIFYYIIVAFIAFIGKNIEKKIQ
ncbi:MAG: polar amino acid transport system permease protein [Candidatus Midichloriaceae bacterium]|jgi:polar amino acid transport system permease protein